ncbi:HPF/RaiA family ribosome-associated protein [Oscillochloris sp. ZM17-4]|uniref:HPF/RaiA family ribosome-associated protein n=1 Tax=Oscillochloris sp. ZM17-4 TaxID=2866714 RepID=UPI001C72E0B5|nr:HPF/RaiA family ribosome-associated protein [Oscillochloris sp. ZM17-4]MBX0328345.1 HPF/RaiA family ribosome-associated protein [Oscillochloris sp. ZM17-4]
MTMLIQINTDSNIQADASLTQKVDAIIADRITYFGEQITRLDVHLSDENSDKKVGAGAKRCLLVADLAGMQSIEVSDHASTVEQAIEGAAQKMKRALDSALGRLSSR